MCAAQTNTSNQTFGYTWGFADNSRGESVVEISPNINYTVSDAVRKHIFMYFVLFIIILLFYVSYISKNSMKLKNPRKSYIILIGVVVRRRMVSCVRKKND